MITLIKGGLQYEKVWEEEDKPEEEWSVFTLRNLSAGQVNSIDDQVTITARKGSQIQFLGGTSRRLKIKAALVDWRNVLDEDKKEVKCTDANKEALPAEIQSWLEDDINEVNRLDKRDLEETERKNS